ncbi:uncharacterized protein LOC144622162 [Crassostrea virginica]
MTANEFVDTSSQKGAIPGFSGCLEHTSILSQLIREMKADNEDLTVVWLDLANAYGSIPHKLIETALDHYYIPDHIKVMVKNYFSGMMLQFSAGNITTAHQSLEKGIVTGCTVSPILFIMGMNIIMKAAERETRGPKMNSGIYQPANRGFMDDLTVTTKSHVQARWVLSALEEVISWARMKFKPRKSRYMIIKKGRISEKFQLKVQGENIPSIVDEPIKCLGKWFDDTLTDKNKIENIQSRTSQLQMPLSSVVEEFKIEKCRLVMTLRDSKDKKVSEAGVQIRTGRKWSASASVSQAESMLTLRDIIGNTCIGRQGLGIDHFQQWEKSEVKERRDMVLQEVRKGEEDQRRSKAVQLGQQGAWTKWDLPSRKVTWAELWRLEPIRISFMLRSVYDTLPSPSNLCRWVLTEDPSYILETERRKKRPDLRHEKPAIQFVKAEEKVQTTASSQGGLLSGASTWEMRVDLNKRLVFPDVVHTNLRLDIVLWSVKGKKIILIELTVPWEESCGEAHERKMAKYQELLEQCSAKNWSAWLFPVEVHVGARGFPAQSAWRLLQRLGMKGRTKRTAVRRLGEAAERASCWLWSRRDEQTWGPANSE